MPSCGTNIPNNIFFGWEIWTDPSHFPTQKNYQLWQQKSKMWPKLVTIQKATNFGFVPDWLGPHWLAKGRLTAQGHDMSYINAGLWWMASWGLSFIQILIKSHFYPRETHF